MIELGQIALSYRLERGLGLLAICGDFEPRAWAVPRKTLYSTDEWIQRRMARNSMSQVESDYEHRDDVTPDWDREAFNEEFRIWTEEQAAVRKLEVLAQDAKRKKNWHAKLEERRRKEGDLRMAHRKWADSMSVEPERTSETDKAITFIHDPPILPVLPLSPDALHPCSGGCGCMLIDGLSVCSKCDPDLFHRELEELRE